MKRAIALGVACIALFVVAIPALSQGQSLPPGEYDLEEGQYIFNIPGLAPSDTPVASTDTPSPTDTPVLPTDTPIPVPTDTPSAHDVRAWHPLSEELGHEHGDNPHSVDDIFGMQFYAYAGGEISYPWETDRENELKHRFYKWFVGRDLDPNDSTSSVLYVKAFRVQAHFLGASVGDAPGDGEAGTRGGFVNRFHSYYAEALVCYKADPNDCGIARWGRHADYGAGTVNGLQVPLPGDSLDPPVVDTKHGRRPHSAYDPNSNVGGSNVWYENPSYGHPAENSEWKHVSDANRIAISADDLWGGTDPDNPFVLHMACPDVNTCARPDMNSSLRAMHILQVKIKLYLDDGSGRANFVGWTDRFGRLVEDGSCSSPSLDCIPFEASNISTNEKAHYRGKSVEYDTSPPGEWWIRYPN